MYPEIVAALAVVIAFTRIIEPETWPRGRVAHGLVVGLACASLPWLEHEVRADVSRARAHAWPSLRIAPPQPRTGGRRRACRARGWSGASLAWFAFFYAVWGTPFRRRRTAISCRPTSATSSSAHPACCSIRNTACSPYAPVYILAATGLVACGDEGGEPRRRAIETTLVFAALVGTVGAFRIWWGGTASPGRPLASGLLLLALPIAMAARAAPPGTARRAGHQLLLWVSIGVALTLLVAQQGLLIINGRDGTSAVLEYWSPRWDAWSLAPTFIFHEAPTAWLHSLVWLAVAFAAAFALSRWRTRSAGGATLAAMGTFVAALVFIGMIVLPRLPADPPLPEANLLARPRLPHSRRLRRHGAADRGFATIRCTSTAASTLLPLGAVSVAPGRARRTRSRSACCTTAASRCPPAAISVDVAWADSLADAVPLGLQVGRIEPAWKTWSVQPQRGTHWETEFDLPVDASFVGLSRRRPISSARSAC